MLSSSSFSSINGSIASFKQALGAHNRIGSRNLGISFQSSQSSWKTGHQRSHSTAMNLPKHNLMFPLKKQQQGGGALSVQDNRHEQSVYSEY